ILDFCSIWTWPSMPPGRTRRPRSSISSAAPASAFPSATILPPLTPTSQSIRSVAVTTVPFLMTRSNIVATPPAAVDRLCLGIDRVGKPGAGWDGRGPASQEEATDAHGQNRRRPARTRSKSRDPATRRGAQARSLPAGRGEGLGPHCLSRARAHHLLSALVCRGAGGSRYLVRD